MTPHTHKTTLWLDGEECDATVTYWLHEKADYECATPSDRCWVEIESVALEPSQKVREFLVAQVEAARERQRQDDYQESLAAMRHWRAA